MLGSGVILFDSMERATISIESEKLDGGSVTCEGTEALLVPMEAVGTLFAKVNNVSVQTGICSDDQAIQRLLDGQVDVALTTRLPSVAERKLATEKNVILRPLVIAYEALDIIVATDHPDESLNSMRPQVVNQIFVSGESVGWDEATSAGQGIVRPLTIRDGGIAEALRHGVSAGNVKRLGPNVVRLDDAAQLIAMVADDKSAIAIVPRRFVDDRVRTLTIDGDVCVLRRPFYLLVTGGMQSEASRRFVEFTLSKLGQNVIGLDGLMSFRN